MAVLCRVLRAAANRKRHTFTRRGPVGVEPSAADGAPYRELAPMRLATLRERLRPNNMPGERLIDRVAIPQ
ncbi:MAG: hypothetical protein H0T05_04925 [Acidobacteria bacterium]|nr:hypothetical protein [Acidobacteriota bacterium]MBA3887133.1 hypothetical protein [Acidobacteriota bacterium]